MIARRWAIVMAVGAAAYMLFAIWQGVLFLRSGNLIAALLGIAVLALPLLGLWMIYRELRFGLAVQTLAERLDREGALPLDDLPDYRVAGSNVMPPMRSSNRRARLWRPSRGRLRPGSGCRWRMRPPEIANAPGRRCATRWRWTPATSARRHSSIEVG